MQDRATGVAIVGAGVITAVGNSPSELRAAVVKGELCAEEITAFEPSEGEPTWGCECAEFVLADFLSSAKGYNDRTSAMLLASGAMALREAKLIEDGSKCELEVGLSYGSEWGCLDSMEVFYSKLRDKPARFAPPLPFSHSYVNSSASSMAIQFGLKGHHVVYSNGANSSGLSLIGAMDAISLGRVERILASSADSFSRAAFRHYHALGLLAQNTEEITENQFLLSEGAASVLLCNENSINTESKIYGHLLSASITTAQTQVEALERAIKDAISRAGISTREITEIIGCAASRSATKNEADAVNLFADLIGVPHINVGKTLGYTMSCGMLFGVAAACANEASGYALIICHDELSKPSSATAAVISIGK